VVRHGLSLKGPMLKSRALKRKGSWIRNGMVDKSVGEQKKRKQKHAWCAGQECKF